MLYFILGCVLGTFIGGLCIGLFVKKKPCGYLRVDHSDPSDPPLLFLELETSVEHVTKQKEVTFKVKVENYLPHN